MPTHSGPPAPSSPACDRSGAYAYRKHQLRGAEGTAMHRAVSASIILLEREASVQRLLAAVVEVSRKTLDALVDEVEKNTP